MKKLIKRIYNAFFKKSEEPINANDLLISKGIIKTGENCEISNLKVYSHLFNGQSPNVIIGNDCQILGQIELQSKEATVIIGNRVYIGPNTKIFCRNKIEIEDDVLISWGCTLIDTNFHSLNFDDRKDDVIDGIKGWSHLKWKGVVDKPTIIRSKSWIGFNTIINKGVIVEEGTVVACGSVLSGSTEKYTVVGGNPAKFIKNVE